MNLLLQDLGGLTEAERRQLLELAEGAGMSVEEWLEYSLKGQIYHNAEEVLMGSAA